MKSTPWTGSAQILCVCVCGGGGVCPDANYKCKVKFDILRKEFDYEETLTFLLRKI